MILFLVAAALLFSIASLSLDVMCWYRLRHHDHLIPPAPRTPIG